MTLKWVPGRQIGPYKFGASVDGLGLRLRETRHWDFEERPDDIYDGPGGVEVMACNGRITTVNNVSSVHHKGKRLEALSVSQIGRMLGEEPEVMGPYPGYGEGWMSYWFAESRIAVVAKVGGDILHFSVWGE